MKEFFLVRKQQGYPKERIKQKIRSVKMKQISCKHDML